MSRRSNHRPADGEPPEQLSLPLWNDPELPHPPAPSPFPMERGKTTEEARSAASTPSPAPLERGQGGEAAPAAVERESPPPTTGNRLSDLVPRYLEFAIAIDRSPHTIKTTRIDLNLLVRFLGDRPAATVSLDDLRRYSNWLRLERQNDPRSLRRKVASVKAFFAYLRQAGTRDDDPAERLIYPSTEPHLPEFLESDEAEKLIAAAERPMWRALVITLLDTGLKRDEILALHPADVYFDPTTPEHSYLTVRATNEARRIRVRTLRLTARLIPELRRQIETGAGDRIFPISVRAVNAIVETCGLRAGLRKRGPISPQMLRDTFAIQEVRRRLADENRARRAGAPEHEIPSMRAHHDLEVCDLLGLAPVGTNDPIARYRLLAAAGELPNGASAANSNP